MGVPVDLRMKYYLVLICAQLAFVACAGRAQREGCDLWTASEYTIMPPRDGYSRVISKARETDGYLEQSLRLLCNPCQSPVIELEIRNISKESIEFFAINEPDHFLDRSGLSLSTYFEVEDSEGNEVEFSAWHDFMYDTSGRSSAGRCYKKEERDDFFIPLKPGESYVFTTHLSFSYKLGAGKYRVRYTGPFDSKWYTEWVEFEIVDLEHE